MLTKLFASRSSWRYAYPGTNTQVNYLLCDLKYYNRHFPMQCVIEKYTNQNKLK